MTNHLKFAWILLVVGIIYLPSCAGDGSELDATGVPLAPPEIAADRSHIEVSLVAGTRDSVDVRVANVGGFPLEIYAVTSEQSFLEPLLPGPVRLAQDESTEVTIVVVADSVSSFEGTVEISSNAHANPSLQLTVALAVTSAPEPDISIAAASVSVVEGAVDTFAVEVTNVGTADLTINDVQASTDVLQPLGQSFTIPPDSSLALPVRVEASGLEPGLTTLPIELWSNDPDEPRVTVDVEVEVTYAGPFPPIFSAIQSHVIDGGCLLGGCHGEPWAPLGLYLAEGEAWSHLVDVPAALNPDMNLVEPFDPDNSWLIVKLVELDERRVGNRMPPEGEGNYLDEETIAVIRRWIDEGALNN